MKIVPQTGQPQGTGRATMGISSRGFSGRVACLFTILAGLALLAAAPLGAGEMGKEKFKVGDSAPDFAIADLDGKAVKLTDFSGKKVVLLNFWGLRCGACLEEMPYLEAIYQKFSGKDVMILGVDTDGVDAQTIKDTMKEIGVSVTYPLLVDAEFKATDTFTNFLVPLTLVIDKKGVIQYIHTGFDKGTEKHYEEAVTKALGS
jgi:peroxiredoxin